MSVYRASKLIGQPVFILDNDTKKPEKLSHILIHPDNGQLLAAITGHGVFTIKEIIKGEKGLEIQVLPVKEEDKESISTFLREKIFVIKAKAETESGNYLGRVTDFDFDDVSWQIERIYISDRVLFRALSSQLQIPRDDILSIGHDRIIVRDGLVKRGAAANTEGESEYVSIGSGATLLNK